MAMPYRYQEILQALADHPEGLKLQSLMKICRDRPGSELPNDSSVVSKILYSMRVGSTYISKHDTPGPGGSLYKLAAKGREALNEALAREPDAPRKDAAEPQDEQVVAEAVAYQAPPSTLTLHIGDPLDAPFIAIISALREAQQQTKNPPIQNKQEKIDTLHRLGALMSDDIKAIFDDIAEDLRNMESD